MNPYLGEIRMVSFPFAPVGWMFCNGQVLPIGQYAALFSLLGTYYGGNGTSNFALPNLQGCSAMHFGAGGPGTGGTYNIGQTGGEVSHTLLMTEMPAHTHTAYVSTTATLKAPGPTLLPGSTGESFYNSAATVNTTMNPTVLTSVGGNQPHTNLMPYQVVNFIISTSGIFPPRG